MVYLILNLNIKQSNTEEIIDIYTEKRFTMSVTDMSYEFPKKLFSQWLSDNMFEYMLNEFQSKTNLQVRVTIMSMLLCLFIYILLSNILSQHEIIWYQQCDLDPLVILPINWTVITTSTKFQ